VRPIIGRASRITQPMNERDCVKVFIERRYNRRGTGTCC
jgi:hypothetical protein